MQDQQAEKVHYQHLLVGVGYLAVAVPLPYLIFVLIGVISLSWQILWHLIPLTLLACAATYLKKKMKSPKEKQITP